MTPALTRDGVHRCRRVRGPQEGERDGRHGEKKARLPEADLFGPMATRSRMG